MEQQQEENGINKKEILINKINKLFSNYIKNNETKPLIIDIVKNNGRDFYEAVEIRKIPNNNDSTLPDGSYNIEHYSSIPISNNSGEKYTIHNVFTFTVNNQSIQSYYSQTVSQYNDALKKDTHGFYIDPEKQKQIFEDLQRFIKVISNKINNKKDISI